MIDVIFTTMEVTDDDTVVYTPAQVGYPVPGATTVGGLPPGGATGQQLTKRSSDDGDVNWSDAMPPVFDAGTFN